TFSPAVCRKRIKSLMDDKVPVMCPMAPAAIGPYSQAIKCGNLVFVSGQIPVDPNTGQVIGQDAAQQTKVVITHIESILSQVEATLGHVVKTTVYLSDLNNFEGMNAVYGHYFNYEPPARATIEVSRLPKDVLVEIEAIAMLPPSKAGRMGVGTSSSLGPGL